MEAKLSKQIKQQQDTERKSFLNLQKREYKLTKEQMKRVSIPSVLAQYDFRLQNVIRILKNHYWEERFGNRKLLINLCVIVLCVIE